MTPRPTRLLFLMSRFLDGGIDTVLVEYLARLAQRPEYRLTLAVGISMGALEVYRDRLPREVSLCYLVDEPWLTWGARRRVEKRMPAVLKAADEALITPLRRLLQRRRLHRLADVADVVVDFDSCFYSPLRGVRTPRVAFFHFSFALIMEQDPRRMTRMARQLAHYDRVVLLSQAMREEGTHMFPALAKKFVVIYNAKDPARLRALAAEQPADVAAAAPFVLAVERLAEPKDIPTLLEAFALLRRRHGHRDLQLRIIGKGPYEEALRQQAQQMGLHDGVVFMGFVANPYPWMAACRLLAFSSKAEGLPTVLIEGLLLDVPIVSTDCPTGPHEILADGQAGLLTPVGDAQAMALAMHRLLTDDALRQQLAQGRRRQATLFTFDTVDRQLDELFAIAQATS